MPVPSPLTAAVAALVVAVGGIATVAAASDDPTPAAATTATGAYNAPSCDPDTFTCTKERLAALEGWVTTFTAATPDPTPTDPPTATPTDSPTPTTDTPTPTPTATTGTPTPSDTPTVTPTPTPTDTEPAHPKALLGMSAPANLWDQRKQQVEATGGHLQARRIFLSSFTASLNNVSDACAEDLYPVVSFKTGSYSWAQVAAGNADADLRALAGRLAALPCDLFATIHHEPNGDGTAANWSSMEVHALPILGVSPDVEVGVIGNGWWWSAQSNGLSDAEIAQWITPQVRLVSDVIGGDTYSSSAEGSAPKMKRMSAWKARVGYPGKLGVGEFNSATAADIKAATDELGSNKDFAWGLVWNSTGGDFTPLTGDRLTTFQQALAGW